MIAKLKEEIEDRLENIDNEKKLLTAKEYFDNIKEMKHSFTEKDLENVYNNCLYLANKAYITGQRKSLKKLLFCMQCLEKEKALIDLGINTFVYLDDIDYFIDNVRKKTVKIIELEDYEREIPDDILDIIVKTKDIFDVFYIVFTDYTGKVERQIEKERRDKDPILFGSFQSKTTYTVIDRFYYLGDWEDDYCDLTLEKMVSQMREVTDTDIRRSIGVPKSLDELRKQLDSMDENGFVKPKKVEESVD